MKRILSFVAVLSLVVAAVAFAKAGEEKAEHKAMEGHTHSMAAAKTGTWTGEILDASCYLGHGAMGAKHTECAAKCAANGAPMNAAHKDGKVILLTPPHDNPDAYNQAKTLAGTMAVITARAVGAQWRAGHRGHRCDGCHRRSDEQVGQRNGVRGAVTRALFLCRPAPRPAVAVHTARCPCSASGSPRARSCPRPSAAGGSRTRGLLHLSPDPPAQGHAQRRRTDKTVPTFAGDLMMYATTRTTCARGSSTEAHRKKRASHSWQAQREAAPWRMPAFRRTLSAASSPTSVAYVMAVSDSPEPRTRSRSRPRPGQGAGCTGCHGTVAGSRRRIPGRSRATSRRGWR